MPNARLQLSQGVDRFHNLCGGHRLGNVLVSQNICIVCMGFQFEKERTSFRASGFAFVWACCKGYTTTSSWRISRQFMCIGSHQELSNIFEIDACVAYWCVWNRIPLYTQAIARTSNGLVGILSQAHPDISAVGQAHHLFGSECNWQFWMIKNEKKKQNKFKQKASESQCIVSPPTPGVSTHPKNRSRYSAGLWLRQHDDSAPAQHCRWTISSMYLWNSIEFYRHREGWEESIFFKMFHSSLSEGVQTSRLGNLLCCGFDKKHDLTVVPSCYGCIKNVFVIFAIIVPVVYEWLLHPASSATVTCKTTPFHNNKVLLASPDVIQTSSKCLDMSRMFALTWLDSPESRVRLSSLLCREMTSAPNPATNRERW